MKTFSLTNAVIMMALLAVTAGPIGAATSNGPYYATPSWDQQLDCSSAANCPRFVVLSNWIDADHPSGGAAVLDRETGLVWEQSPSTSTFQWSNPTTGDTAAVHCNNSTVGNRKGWRLPVVQELASLVDATVPFPGPTLPAGHPFSNVQSSLYWSATTSATVSSLAWGVFFNAGVVGFQGFNSKTLANFVWCVRGGHGVDPQ